MNNYKWLNNVWFIILAVIIPLAASAQKQPQVQEISMRAPDNVKVDGKMNEWPSPFLSPQKTDGYLNAYNSSSRVFYTVANDDNNLYFVIRGLGSGVANKMLAGGLVITISHLIDHKRTKAADNVTITFPVPQDVKTTGMILSTIATAGELVDEDSVANRKQIDSIGGIANKQMNNVMKEIWVVGVKEIPDSVVSIYNTMGIKAAAQFIKRQPIVELAIPLKYLNLDINNPVKFSYNIRLNVRTNDNPRNIREDAPSPQVLMTSVDVGTMHASNPGTMFMLAPTDFWGLYTLVKKP